MARTKASVGAKVSSGKSSKARCCAPPPSSMGASGGTDRSSRSHSGGNPVCPRETPIWQRLITNFIVTKKAVNEEIEETPRSSKLNNNTNKFDEEIENKTKVTESDEERNETTPKRYQISDEETPKNRELDESLVLEPLTGANSHKIDEYYKNNNKGKGKGKKTKDNNNLQDVKRNLKRDLEDITFGEEIKCNKRARIE